MAILARPQIKASHWYTASGEPMHTILKADGSGERPTDVRDARKLGLLPSVTNVLSVMGKEALTTWRVNQAIIAAHESPKKEDESIEYYIKRISSASLEQVVEAADLGSRIHSALEGYLMEGKEPPQELAIYIDPVREWFKQTAITVTACEKRLVSTEWGYAGTADVLFRYGKNGRGVLDFKTRKTKEGKKVEPYDGQAMQLAAYAAVEYGTKELDDVLIANIYISTTEPGRVEVVKHKDVMAHYMAFLNCCALWRYIKNMDPRKQEGA